MPALAAAATQLLGEDAGVARSPARIAEGAERTFQILVRHLARVVGDAGSQALVARSVVLAAAEHPWLLGAENMAARPAWSALRSSLERRSPEEAAAAFASLLAVYVGLLSRLIGKGLTDRLLFEVWPDVFPLHPRDKETP